MKTTDFGSLTNERIKNGLCEILEEEVGEIEYDKEGIIQVGAYKGQLGCILLSCKDISALHHTIKVLSGTGAGVEMCYSGAGYGTIKY